MAFPTGWSVAAASVRGKSHEESGDVCQDSHCVESSSDGAWLAVAVSDGAGTAAKSDQSSRLVCRSFAKFLLDQVPKLQRQPPGDWLTDAILRHVLDFRESLRQKSGSEDLRPFNCTLLAALLGPDGGISVHIGDGALFGGTVSSQDRQTVDFSSKTWVSNPENGEYANETFFITEKSWVKHLRVFPLSKLDWLVVGTDGGTALALDGKNVPKTSFVLPVFEQIGAQGSDLARGQCLTEILSNPQADRVTGDDKTLVVAFRNGVTRFHGAFEIPASPAAEPAGKNPTSETTFPKLIETSPPGVTLPEPASPGRRLRTSFGFAVAFLVLGLAAIWGWEYSQSGELLPSFLQAFQSNNTIANGFSGEASKLAERDSPPAKEAGQASDTHRTRRVVEITLPAKSHQNDDSSGESQESPIAPPGARVPTLDITLPTQASAHEEHTAIPPTGAAAVPKAVGGPQSSGPSASPHSQAPVDSAKD